MAYFYKIKDTLNGKIYVGVRVTKKLEPNVCDLFVKYFTSSKIVKNTIKESGKDRFLIERIVFGDSDYVIALESKYLKAMYNFLGRETFRQKFYNKNINGKCFFLTPEEDRVRIEKSILTMNEKRLNGDVKYHTGPINISDEERLRRSNSMKGNNYGALNEWSEETREKVAEKSRGNTNVRDTKWWFNEKENIFVRSKICPGDEWINKGHAASDNQKQVVSNIMSNRDVSLETRMKLSIAAQQRPSNAKGTIWVKNKDGKRKRVFPDQIPEGFYKVKNDEKIETN